MSYCFLKVCHVYSLKVHYSVVLHIFLHSTVCVVPGLGFTATSLAVPDHFVLDVSGLGFTAMSLAVPDHFVLDVLGLGFTAMSLAVPGTLC